jgi:hypothetical protein
LTMSAALARSAVQAQEPFIRPCRRRLGIGAGPLSVPPFTGLGLGREVADEPVPGQPGGRVEGARLLEQVGGAGQHS